MTSGVSSAKKPSGRPWGKSKMRKYIGNLTAAAVAAVVVAGPAPARAHAVIVSSALFRENRVDLDFAKALSDAVGPERVIAAVDSRAEHKESEVMEV